MNDKPLVLIGGLARADRDRVRDFALRLNAPRACSFSSNATCAMSKLAAFTALTLNPLFGLAVIGAIILIAINSQFYVFLAAKRGRLFALAAVPFHLLYHFYNGISFVIGLVRYSFLSAFAASPVKNDKS